MVKIAIINVTWYYGSTGQLAYNLYDRILKNGHSARLYYGRKDDPVDDPDIVRIDTPWEIYMHAALSRLSGREGQYSRRATRRLIRDLERFAPDAIILFNLVGYYLNHSMLFGYINQKKIPTVYCMIDEYAYCGKCCYPGACEKWKNRCGRCEQKKGYPRSLFFDTSSEKQREKLEWYGSNPWYSFAGPQYVCERAMQSTILENAHFTVLDECINTDVFCPRDISGLRKELGIPDENRVIMNVCPVSNERKGAKYYFEAIRRMKGDKTTFIHVGCDMDHAEYPENMIQVGYLYDQEKLSKYLSMADVLVCTSTEDTMPNICLEALACGTPILGFRTSGIPYVADDVCGTFISPGAVDELAEAMEKITAKDEAMIRYCRDYALERYSFEKYYRTLMNICQDNRMESEG